MAEAPRFELGQPFGFATLAVWWVNRSPMLPYFGAPTRTQTETPKATVFETVVYVVPP